VTFRRATFDHHVLIFDVSRFLQTLADRAGELRVIAGRGALEISDHRHCRLLRSRAERQRGRRARNHFDEIAPSHFAP
jgi:hypothetical protein